MLNHILDITHISCHLTMLHSSTRKSWIQNINLICCRGCTSQLRDLSSVVGGLCSAECFLFGDKRHFSSFQLLAVFSVCSFSNDCWCYMSWFVCCLLQEAQTYAEDTGLLFMETSAKTAMNVNELFLAIGECLFLLLHLNRQLEFDFREWFRS